MSSDAGSEGSLQERFDALAAQWQRETGHHSSPSAIAEHPAYQEILRMGEAAIPMILRDLAKTRKQWFRALHQLTGASPVPYEDRGRIEAMTAAWLEWGRRSGYVD